ETGKPHFALLELAEPVTETGGKVLRVTFEFKSAHIRHGLGRFRLSVSGEPATFDREDKRFAVTKLTDPWGKLAAAYAVDGRNDKAVEYFAKAVQRADGRAGKAMVIAAATMVPGLLEKLAESNPNDAEFQAELARYYARGGNQPLANAARTK